MVIGERPGCAKQKTTEGLALLTMEGGSSSISGITRLAVVVVSLYQGMWSASDGASGTTPLATENHSKDPRI